jgi:hypothetical protein
LLEDILEVEDPDSDPEDELVVDEEAEVDKEEKNLVKGACFRTSPYLFP